MSMAADWGGETAMGILAVFPAGGGRRVGGGGVGG